MLGLIIFPVFYLVIYFILVRPRFSGQLSLILLILMPFLGKAAYWLFQFYTDVAGQTMYLAGRRNYKSKIEIFVKKRRKMIELILDKVNF